AARGAVARLRALSRGERDKARSAASISNSAAHNGTLPLELCTLQRAVRRPGAGSGVALLKGRHPNPGGRAMGPPPPPELFRPPLTYPPIPYGQMLDRPVTLYPEHEAVVFGDTSITFRELEGLVNAFANALRT